MDPSALAGQARGLAMRGRCPACAESVTASMLFRGEPCPHCEIRTSMLASFGADLDGKSLSTAMRTRGRRQLIGVAIGVGLAHLFLGWIPLVGAAVLLGATVWIRIGILMPGTRALSRRRQLMTRFTARIMAGVLLAATVIFSEVLTLIGPFGLPIKAVLSAAEVAIAAAAVTGYVHWQIRREADHVVVEGWEYAIVGIASFALFAAAAAVAGTAFMLATAIDKALGFLVH